MLCLLCSLHDSYSRLDEGEDVEITEEKSAEQVSAEELKRRIQAEEAEDGIVCLE